jgi:hypothetical protein
LLPRARRLDHLLAGAIELAEEPIAEMTRRVIDNASFLIREQTFVSTMRRDEPLFAVFLVPAVPLVLALATPPVLSHYDAAVEEGFLG